MTVVPDRRPTHESRAGRHRRVIRRRIVTKWWFWTAIGVLLVVGSAGLWVGLRGLEAKSNLEASQALIDTLKDQVSAFSVDEATATYAEAKEHTEAARELTGDPIWRAAEALPGLGVNLTAFREMSETIDDLMVDGVSPLLDVAGTVTPESLAPKDGAINVAPLEAAIPVVAGASEAFAAAEQRVALINTEGAISQIAEAKQKLSSLLTSVTPSLDLLNTMLPLAGPLMGSEAPRTYVLMFQNNAELRALGGAALSFALLRVDNGHIELVETQSSTFSGFEFYPTSVLPIPDGASGVFPDNTYGSFISNVSLRPSFEGAAQLTQEFWRLKFGVVVDGVMSIDPVALSYILGATGPLTLATGDVLDENSLVGLILNKVYIRYYTGHVVRDNLAADAFFGEAINATFAALTSGPLKTDKLMSAIQRGLDEHRLLFWSGVESEQATLRELGLPGEVPVSDETEDRVGIYFQDGVGAKLDYYLVPSVQLSSGMCRTDGLTSFRASVALQYDLDPAAVSTLPPAVVGNWKIEKLPKGRQRVIVLLYAAPNSVIQSVAVNGQPVAFQALHDTVFPVAKAVVEMDPGQTGTVTFDYVSTSAGNVPYSAQVTPTAKATTITTVPLDCATVPAG